MDAGDSRTGERGALARIGEWLLKILGLFVILEPIWMLLPFAGFLYGSVLRIQTLNQNPSTAWLTHFVFPVLTLGLVGPILVVVGFLVFLVGAGQIYWAKLRRSGLVTRGLYRFVRHPQYIALTLFSVGILLTWGRAIMWLAFFLMMFLYYYLAKSEERACIRLFGDAYERFRERTSFILPGDRALRPLGAKLAALRLPAPVRVTGAFLLTMAVCFLLMWLVQSVKAATISVPYLTTTVRFAPSAEGAEPTPVVAHEAAGVPFVQSGRLAVVRGPYRNAQASGFAERVLQRLRQSKTLEGFLDFLDEPAGDAAIVFCGPYEKPAAKGQPGMHKGGGPGDRGPAPDPHGPDRVRLILMRCTLSAGASIGDALADESKRQIRRGCIALVDLARPASEDFVVGDGRVRGPGFPGDKLWAFFLKQLAQRPAAAPRALPAAVPGRHAEGTLVLVRAPILRTRMDADFAQGILDRLAGSPRFVDRLRASGVGGDLIAVAFPRPGPNWYREHHGTPQISVFVILAQRQSAATLDDLFRRASRTLASAFIADMDFAIAAPKDSVTGITAIGPWRDLEERWSFFLSGLGGPVVHHH